MYVYISSVGVDLKTYIKLSLILAALTCLLQAQWLSLAYVIALALVIALIDLIRKTAIRKGWTL